MLSPDEIEIKEFVPTLRGYSREEVRAFLRVISDDIRRLEEELAATRAGRGTPPGTTPSMHAELRSSIKELTTLVSTLAEKTTTAVHATTVTDQPATESAGPVIAPVLADENAIAAVKPEHAPEHAATTSAQVDEAESSIESTTSRPAHDPATAPDVDSATSELDDPATLVETVSSEIVSIEDGSIDGEEATVAPTVDALVEVGQIEGVVDAAPEEIVDTTSHVAVDVATQFTFGSDAEAAPVVTVDELEPAVEDVPEAITVEGLVDDLLASDPMLANDPSVEAIDGFGAVKEPLLHVEDEVVLVETAPPIDDEQNAQTEVADPSAAAIDAITARSAENAPTEPSTEVEYAAFISEFVASEIETEVVESEVVESEVVESEVVDTDLVAVSFEEIANVGDPLESEAELRTDEESSNQSAESAPREVANDDSETGDVDAVSVDFSDVVATHADTRAESQIESPYVDAETERLVEVAIDESDEADDAEELLVLPTSDEEPVTTLVVSAAARAHAGTPTKVEGTKRWLIGFLRTYGGAAPAMSVKAAAADCDITLRTLERARPMVASTQRRGFGDGCLWVLRPEFCESASSPSEPVESVDSVESVESVESVATPQVTSEATGDRPSF